MLKIFLKRVSLFFLVSISAISRGLAETDSQVLQACATATYASDFRSCWETKCKVPLAPLDYYNIFKNHLSNDEREKFNSCISANRCRDLDDKSRNLRCTETLISQIESCEDSNSSTQQKKDSCVLVNGYKSKMKNFLERDIDNCVVGGFETPAATLEKIEFVKKELTKETLVQFTLAAKASVDTSCISEKKYMQLCSYLVGPLKNASVRPEILKLLPDPKFNSRVFSAQRCATHLDRGFGLPADEELDDLVSSYDGVDKFITETQKKLSATKGRIENLNFYRDVCERVKKSLESCSFKTDVDNTGPSQKAKQ